MTIPANAANVEGAKALADVLLDPVLQAAKADPAKLGNPTVLDAARLGDAGDAVRAAARRTTPTCWRTSASRAGVRGGARRRARAAVGGEVLR